MSGNTIKIFIGNLSNQTTSDKLRPLFEKYGDVVECDVLKNFGFVHMSNKNDANKAIAQLDGYNVDDYNIRVELSTGKKGNGGGGGGKFDKKGFGGGGPGGPRGRPYPPPRDFGRDFDRYPYPLPPSPFDRYADPYYRLLMAERDPYLRMGGPLGDRGARDRYPPLPLPRDRLADRYADPRDRLPPPRSFMEERAARLTDSLLRERESSLAARPPPEYYDRKAALGGMRGADALAGLGGRGGGDYFRGGAAAGGAGGAQDFLGRSSQGGGNFRQNGPMGGGGGGKDSQSSFANDGVFF